jgi:hypothetical protein
MFKTEVKENGNIVQILKNKNLHTAIRNFNKLYTQQKELKSKLDEQKEVIEAEAFDLISGERKSVTLVAEDIELTVAFPTKYRIEDIEALREAIPEDIFSNYISTKHQTKSGFYVYIESNPNLIKNKIITQDLQKSTIKIK